MHPSPLKRLAVPALLAACCAALPAQAAASHAPQPVRATATISSCNDDSLTIGTEIEPLSGDAAGDVPRRLTRKLSRARLKISIEATPLFGDGQRTKEVDVGRGLSARRFERFGGLPANTYSGIVRYRWVRGSKTILKDIVRTTKGRAAGRRGKAYCSLPIGRQPQDTSPPFVVPIPYDSAWKRGPLDVLFYAVDDLSGVSGVFWRIDNGPFRTGRTARISTEGSHTVQYLARDVAGNSSKLGKVTLRVDMNPPTAPTISSPAGATGDSTPDITWSPSSDSASGVAAYFVLVRNSGNAIVFGQAVRAAGPFSLTVSEALAPGQYTAQVIALDGATPQPFSTTASSAFSVTG